MPAMVALLRGINVGGANRISMADVRRVTEACGYRQVQTYIQSGNIVFFAAERDTEAVAGALRAALAEHTPVQPDVIVRTREELRTVIARNPYAGRETSASQLHVLFAPGIQATPLAAIDLPAFAPEEMVASGREVYLYLPDGLGRSKLATTLLRGHAGRGTMRNWRTVTTLMAMVSRVAE